MILTDTHTHLYASEFDVDRTQIIERAITLGVSRYFLPNIDSESIVPLFNLVKQFPKNCFPMMGLHPCSVNEKYQEELKVVEYWLEKKNKNAEEKFCAIGEIGIDLYWDKTFFEQQKDAFEKQIQLAIQYNLPIVIHTRNSFDETFEIVYEYRSQLKGVFHCFSGNAEHARKIMDLGTFKMGIGGVVTFKNAGVAEVVKYIPMEYLVLETDAPYLAPTPYRGRRNEPEYLLLVAQKISEIKNIPLEKVAEITTENSRQIFKI